MSGTVTRNMDEGFRLEDYDYELPEELIAQRPSRKREQSRLMVLRHGAQPRITSFSGLLEHLPPRSLIVVNNSKVVPARLRGAKGNQGRVELVLLSPLDVLNAQMHEQGNHRRVEAQALVRPSKSVRPGADLFFPELRATVLEKGSFGQCVVNLEWESGELAEILVRHGEIPLPPYIRRNPDQEDLHRYQTIYASETELGSVAAPTAGLHFTQEMKSALLEAGHSWCELTLFVGYGTFSPIRSEDIREHVMHSEFVKIGDQAAEAISRARHEKRPIIAVGTTSLRSLEGVLQKTGAIGPYQGWLDTYIYPGFRFAVATGLITNFHLPRSSLLVLVSALAGRERILRAYRRAVEEKMRFFSYGDAMFIDMTDSGHGEEKTWDQRPSPGC